MIVNAIYKKMHEAKAAGLEIRYLHLGREDCRNDTIKII
jgi:hypothetical protein